MRGDKYLKLPNVHWWHIILIATLFMLCMLRELLSNSVLWFILFFYLRV